MADDLQVSRFDTFLRKLLSIKRGGLLRAIDPQVQLALDPFSQPEFAYLQGARLWSLAQGLGGAAGVISTIAIHNPPGSGVFCVVEKLTLAFTPNVVGLDVWIINDSLAALAGFTSNPLQQTDTRLLLAASPASSVVSKVQTAQSVGFAGTINAFLGNNGAFTQLSEFPVPVILTPGFSLAVRPTAVLQGLGIFASGYERPFEASEK